MARRYVIIRLEPGRMTQTDDAATAEPYPWLTAEQEDEIRHTLATALNDYFARQAIPATVSEVAIGSTT